MIDSVAHTWPLRQGNRRGESTLANRLLRIRHPTPHRDAAFDLAAEIAERSLCDDGNFGNRGHA